jgi:hypothetical protein
MNTAGRKFQEFIKPLRREARIKRCFAESCDCSEDIKMAHSVQNNRILTRLANEGEVIQLKEDIGESGFGIAPRLIGRKVASVATNFCGVHDTKIFVPIEKYGYRPLCAEQEFLFAYRAFAREYHVKLEQTRFYQAALKRITAPDAKRMFMDGLRNSEATLKEMEADRGILNQALLCSDFKQIDTCRLVFRAVPTIAVSSSFALEHDLNGRQINCLGDMETPLKQLMLTVFPEGANTYVLLSYFRRHKKLYSPFFKQISTRTMPEKKVIISNMILAHVENMFMSPIWWARKGNGFQEAVSSLFHRTIASDDGALSTLRDINLFV